MGRISFAVTALIVCAAVLGVASPAVAASRDRSEERVSFDAINSVRASAGRAPLSWSDALADVARTHSAAMQRDGYIYHSRSLGSQISGWKMLGENVGTGVTIGSIDDAFAKSSEHRRNILDRYTRVAVGIVRAPDGTLYVTQVFMQPMQASGARGTRAPARAHLWVHPMSAVIAQRAHPRPRAMVANAPTPTSHRKHQPGRAAATAAALRALTDGR